MANKPLNFGTEIETKEVKAKDSSGLVFKEDGGTTVGAVVDDGSWTMGISQASNPGAHVFYGTQGTIANQNYVLELRANDRSIYDVVIRYGLDRTNGQGFQDCAIWGVGGAGYRFVANTTDVGGHTSGGAWTFGPSSGTGRNTSNFSFQIKGSAVAGSGSGLLMDYNGSAGRFICLGADTSTNGTFEFLSQRSNESNTLSVGTVTGAGAWTLGPQSNTPYDTFHTTYKALFAGTPSSSTDLNGSWRIGANTFNNAGNQPTRVSGLSGSQITFLNRSSDSAATIVISANKFGDSATTIAAVIAEATPAGAWTLGISSGNVGHTINGTLILGSTAPSAVSGTNQTITVAQGGFMRLDSVASGATVARIGLGVINPSGTRIVIMNNGANTLTFNPLEGSSGTNYQILSTQGGFTLAAGSICEFVFDGITNGWRKLY